MELAGFHQIDDRCLTVLSHLKSLEVVELSEEGITDAGLARLQGLTQLKHLYLKNTRVTDAGVKALEKALPNVKIER